MKQYAPQRFLFTALFICLSLISFQNALAVEGGPQARHSLSLLLEPVGKHVKAGTVPAFRLTICNQGTMPERIINIENERRPDLQPAYYDLEVTKDGRPVDLAHAISDPGPLSENDFMTLKPDHKVTFGLSKFPVEFEKLPPGNYEAQVHFIQYTGDVVARDYRSSKAGFTVDE